jgi:hypothetical protein
MTRADGKRGVKCDLIDDEGRRNWQLIRPEVVLSLGKGVKEEGTAWPARLAAR